LFLQASTKDGVMRGYCCAGTGDCKTLTMNEVGLQTMECYEEVSMDLGANI
jgi:hypothetical protein